MLRSIFVVPCYSLVLESCYVYIFFYNAKINFYFDVILVQIHDDTGVVQWRPVFLAITDRDLLLYDLVPWTKEAWVVPVNSIPLVHTRYASLDN